MSRYKFSTLLSLPVLILTGFVLACPGSAAASVAADRAAVLETKMALRDLWVEHVFWIRSYMLATHAHDTAQSKSRRTGSCVQRQSTRRHDHAVLWPEPPPMDLFKLLAGHWGAVRDYNTATLAKSKSAQDKAVADITSNAREIAKFLSGANPESARGGRLWPALLSRRTSRGADQPGRSRSDFPDEAKHLARDAPPHAGDLGCDRGCTREAISDALSGPNMKSSTARPARHLIRGDRTGT